MSGDNLALVHNGIIENNQELKAQLQEIGYKFLSDTDSEVIVHLIDSHLKEGISLVEAIRKSVKRLDGAYAIAVSSTDSADRIVAARSGCPLVIGKGIGENFHVVPFLSVNFKSGLPNPIEKSVTSALNHLATI